MRCIALILTPKVQRTLLTPKMQFFCEVMGSIVKLVNYVVD